MLDQIDYGYKLRKGLRVSMEKELRLYYDILGLNDMLLDYLSIQTLTRYSLDFKRYQSIDLQEKISKIVSNCKYRNIIVSLTELIYLCDNYLIGHDIKRDEYFIEKDGARLYTTDQKLNIRELSFETGGGVIANLFNKYCGDDVKVFKFGLPWVSCKSLTCVVDKDMKKLKCDYGKNRSRNIIARHPTDFEYINNIVDNYKRK